MSWSIDHKYRYHQLQLFILLITTIGTIDHGHRSQLLVLLITTIGIIDYNSRLQPSSITTIIQSIITVRTITDDVTITLHDLHGSNF